MKDNEVNKIIAEFMGKCWHDIKIGTSLNGWCSKCGKDMPKTGFREYCYTESLDSLIPVLNKLSISEIKLFGFIGKGLKNCRINRNRCSRKNTPQQAAAHATAEIILELNGE